MVKIAYAVFQCKRCKKDFWSILEGNFIHCDDHPDTLCFDPEELSPFHGNDIMHPIKGVRLCRGCKKGGDLMSYEIHTT